MTLAEDMQYGVSMKSSTCVGRRLLISSDTDIISVSMISMEMAEKKCMQVIICSVLMERSGDV